MSAMNVVFTKHALEQMQERRITEEEVISIIKYAEKTEKIDDKYYVKKNVGRGIIEVCFVRQNYIKVITVYWIP